MKFARIVATALAVCAAGCQSQISGLVPQSEIPHAVRADVSPRTGTVHVRFLEGAPELETNVAGAPQALGLSSFLTVNGQTVSSGGAYGFAYQWMTQFINVQTGAQTLKVYDSIGYSVGPFTTPPLKAGSFYTVAIVGTYPKYKLLTFNEPAPSTGAALSVYEASPTKPAVDFGTFVAGKACAGTFAGYKKLGSARLGSVVTVSLGKSIQGFGAYVGSGTTPIGNASVPPCHVNAFDVKNALPFTNAHRLSLFLLDAGSYPSPVLGALDR
ncbi:MAG: DUF4397 domain-containing protein [Candidatus Eremiobacteraeota bacterium]|nr:DUF4397 domain-containing protein [Candidatus Eremiobacteraeota bacterium]